MVGYALRNGFNYGNGDVLCVLDADLPYVP
jgi:hypothetical protein